MMGALRSAGRPIEPAATAEDAELDESTTLLDALRVHLAPGPGRASRLHRLRRFVDAMKGEDPCRIDDRSRFTWRRRMPGERQEALPPGRGEDPEGVPGG